MWQAIESYFGAPTEEGKGSRFSQFHMRGYYRFALYGWFILAK